MDKLNGDQPKATFGPEWLSFSKEHSSLSAHFASEDDLSGRYNNTSKVGLKTHYSSVKKVPLRFTRSKSTPLLPNVEEGAEHEQTKDKKPEDVFTMLKERNSFDRNFPTLNTSKPRNIPCPPNNVTTAHSPQNGSSLGSKMDNLSPGGSQPSAWKSSQSKSIPINGHTSQNGNATSPVRESTIETAEMQLATCIVPNVQPPKVLTKNRVELLTKKGPNKRKFDTSILRKATSEPNLPIPAAYQENYAKLMAAKKANLELHKEKFNTNTNSSNSNKEKAPDKLKTGTVVLNRSEFLKGLSKKEVSIGSQEDNVAMKSQSILHRRVCSDQSEMLSSDSSTLVLVAPGEDCRPELREALNSINSSKKEGTEELINGDGAHHIAIDRSISPKLNLEDEEKFLRNLGWLPEEEDHVPELTEEEILEESNKLKNWMNQMTNQKKRFSLGVSCIKKWQNDVLFHGYNHLDPEGLLSAKIY